MTPKLDTQPKGEGRERLSIVGRQLDGVGKSPSVAWNAVGVSNRRMWGIAQVTKTPGTTDTAPAAASNATLTGMLAEDAGSDVSPVTDSTHGVRNGSVEAGNDEDEGHLKPRASGVSNGEGAFNKTTEGKTATRITRRSVPGKVMAVLAEDKAMAPRAEDEYAIAAKKRDELSFTSDDGNGPPRRIIHVGKHKSARDEEGTKTASAKQAGSNGAATSARATQAAASCDCGCYVALDGPAAMQLQVKGIKHMCGLLGLSDEETRKLVKEEVDFDYLFAIQERLLLGFVFPLSSESCLQLWRVVVFVVFSHGLPAPFEYDFNQFSLSEFKAFWDESNPFPVDYSPIGRLCFKFKSEGIFSTDHLALEQGLKVHTAEKLEALEVELHFRRAWGISEKGQEVLGGLSHYIRDTPGVTIENVTVEGYRKYKSEHSVVFVYGGNN